MSEKKKEMKLEIHIDEETAQGIYANLAVVNHSDSEFALDFIFVQPQMPKGKVRSRIVTSPVHAKRLLAALQDNITNFEKQFGTIEITSPPPPLPDGGNYH